MPGTSNEGEEELATTVLAKDKKADITTNDDEEKENGDCENDVDDDDDDDDSLSDCSFFKAKKNSTDNDKTVKNYQNVTTKVSPKINNDNDDSDNDSDDAFCFKKQTFKGEHHSTHVTTKVPSLGKKKVQKKRKFDLLDISSSDSESGNHSDNAMKKGTSITVNENDKKKKQRNKLGNICINLDSDDDDDDDHIVRTTATCTSKNATNTKSETNKSSIHTISMLELDSDNDDDYNTSNMPINTALEKARKAKQLLEEEAKKVNLMMEEENVSSSTGVAVCIDMDNCTTSMPMSMFMSTSTTKPTITTATTNNLRTPIITGSYINIKLRSTIKSAPKSFNTQLLFPNINNKNNKSNFTNDNTTITTLRFRTGTPLQKVFDHYQTLYPNTIHLNSNTEITFILDGEKMNMNQTLEFYDLENDDLIDVVLNIPNNIMNKIEHHNEGSTSINSTISTSNRNRSTTGNNISYVKINTRIKNGNPDKTHMYQLKVNDPFDKLLKAYRMQHGYSSHRPVSLEYANVRINGNQSPLDLGICDGCMIEICDETERVKQVNRMPKSSTTASGPIASACISSRGGISLKVRINGDDKTVTNYGIMKNAPFQTLIDKVCTLNKVSEKDCMFLFDGERLNSKGTPDDEDLEGGEVIDVQIDKKALQEGNKNGNNAVMSNATMSATSSSNSSTKVHNSYTAKGEVINVLCLRNNEHNTRPKKFRVKDDSRISLMKDGYIKYYKRKGCKSVTFYYNNVPITDTKQTFAAVGIKDMEIVAAMENGKKC